MDDNFAEALDDDLNISAALGHLFEQIRESNRELDVGWADPCPRLAGLVGANRSRARVRSGRGNGAARNRATHRSSRAGAACKNWQKSDELRDAILVAGWAVKDTKEGQVLTRRAGA